MRSNYLSFGGSASATRLDALGTLKFLQSAGFGDGTLAQARKGIDEQVSDGIDFTALGANYCDFCFTHLMGGEYDVLDDGRERCPRCSRSVVRTHAEFVELFTATRRSMEFAFEISINVPMRVQMVNAREIARKTGEYFEPTPGVDARVVGFASRDDAGYTINIENGTPALSAITTIVHELTHIWQFSMWQPGMLEARYGDNRALLITEGMATWAQVQYLLSIQEFEAARRQESYAQARTDEYGAGFRLFTEHYPLKKAGVVGMNTPFRSSHPL